MRHKGHNFTSYKVVVGALLLAIAPLGFAEAPALPDFIVSASPAAIRVARNAKGSAIVSTTIFHGFNRSVNLTAAGLPKGAAASFSRSAVAGSGELNSALTISVGNHTPLGTYSVTVSGSAGGDRKSATVTLTVEPSQGLPTGYGWHQLPNTSMTSVCLGNVPNGMYTDDTMTTTTNYTFNCLQVTPFSGGAADDNNQRLIVWGGGHRDYAGNEVSVLNLNGTPSWQALTGPTYPVPAVSGKYAWEGLQPYFVSAADGGVYQPGASPSSRHTFNSLQYVPYQNKLYSFGGSVANLGYFSQETWALDLAAKAWTLVGPPFSQAPAYPTTTYNPTNGHIVMHDKIWSLLDFDPNTGNWTTLTSQYHIEDGTTAAIDPINNLFVVVDSGGSSNGTSYPSVASYHTVLVFPLTPPYAMQTWSDPSCDLPYRNGGLAWDSALGLMVGYPGGGNQVYLLNTGAQDVVTPFGTVPSHKCLDVPISLNPSPVKGVDYPQDPEGSLNGSNWGIYGRFRYFPSLDTFVVMNDRTKNVWTLQLAGGSPAPNFAVSTSPGTLTVPEGSQGTSVISTTVSGGFNNPITLSTAGVPAGTTVSFAPSTIAAPGAGSSTLTINVGASTPAGTYPIVVSAFGGGDTANTSVTLTVSASGPPNFTISALPASLSISQGNQAISTITSTISGVFNSAISLSASGAPLGTTVSFIPNPISAPGAGSSTMTIAVGNNTPTGTYPITVTGNGGGIQQTTTVTLTVTAGAQPNFSISASPASLSIPQGNQAASTITTAVSGGFSSAISLSASGVPSGTTVSFAPSTIPAPGAGNSTMTVTVGSGTPAGAYPITVTGNGGGIQQNATISLTVTAPPAYDVGIDFRSSQNYVTDPAYAVFDNCVNDGITPQTRTNSNGYSVTWQWSQKCNAAADQSNTIDPRLAGMASVYNASGGEALTITVPQPGTYNIGFATGSATGNECGGGKCANFIFKDGASGTQLFTVNPNNPGTAHFIDAANNNWTAAQWPASNQEQTVTLTGTTLTLSMAAGNGANIAHIRLTSVPPKGFTLSASPASLSIAQGNQGTSTITTTINNGFSDSISLSASGTPSGTTVSFSPNPIPVPGAGSSTMSVTVGGNTPTGTYPITVTGNGGGIQQTTMVTLTVSAGAQPDFVLTVLPTQVFVPQGLAGSATVTTWLVGSFNNSISLSTSGAPSGTTVSFNPSTIPAPGSGNSTVTLTVASNTPTGNYPITLTGNGGGKQHTATLNLTVTPQAAFTLSASPASLSIQQGNQGTSTITSTISGGFNSAISLSASGAPSGTTVSFN